MFDGSHESDICHSFKTPFLKAYVRVLWGYRYRLGFRRCVFILQKKNVKNSNFNVHHGEFVRATFKQSIVSLDKIFFRQYDSDLYEALNFIENIKNVDNIIVFSGFKTSNF